MKATKLILFLLTVCLKLSGQNAVLVNDETRYSHESKSYYIVKSLKLGNGFTWSATSQGPFFAKMVNPTIDNIPPSLDKNYVRTESLLVGVISETGLTGLPVEQKSMSYSYVDGLGRPDQEILVQNSPGKLDAVSFTKFDNNERQPVEYLPYAISNGKGAYRPDPVSEVIPFFKNTSLIGNDDEPYKINTFDNSPLNIVRKASGPGKDWHVLNKMVESKVMINIASEVRQWVYNGPNPPTLATPNPPILSGYVPAGTLTVAETKDEENQINRIYKNFRGQTILSRTGDGSNWFDTYYIYDWSGNVFCVIPPQGSANLATSLYESTATASQRQAFLNDWAFQYDYDDYNRLRGKKVPGTGVASTPGVSKGWLFIVYDKWDRIVLTQDGKQRNSDQWTFTKYDEFNRPIMTGFYINSGNQATVQAAVDAYASLRFENRVNDATGYTQTRTFPPSPAEANLLTVTYYDDYAFVGYTNWDAQGKNYAYVQENGLPASTALLATYKGQTTGNKVRMLGGDSRWLNSVTYYDNKYRAIQTISENHLTGTDRLSDDIDFAGRIKKTLRTHTTAAGSYTSLDEYEYDHAGRLLKTWQTLDGVKVLVSSQKHNEAGQVIEKNLHSTDLGATFLQSLDYRYNVRGWLTSINNSSLTNDGSLNNDTNDIFGMQLLYNQSPGIISDSGTPIPSKYNGNIAAIKWKSTNLTGSPKEKIFGFNYDVLNRLSSAKFATSVSGNFTGDAGMFNNAYSYDRNGNITSLTRQGLMGSAMQTIDNLTYGWAGGNTLKFVNDASAYKQFGAKGQGFVEKTNMTSSEYTYDDNGNAIQDVNRGVDVTYNHLNMPSQINFSASDYIQYTYDALGTKLKEKVFKGGAAPLERDYIGGVHYENNILAFVTNGEGRALKTGSSWQYEYSLRDHQGNSMATFGNLKNANVYKACMEPEKVTYEEATFKNIYNRRSTDFNKTIASAEVPVPNNSILTNGSISTKEMGPAIKVPLVNTGDKIKMSVFTRSVTPATNPLADVIAGSLVGLVTSGFGIGVGETAYGGFNSYLPTAAATITADGSGPKAYLNYLLFNSTYTSYQFGYVPVPLAAALSFQKLEIEFTVPAGYVNGDIYIYTTNESNYNVYFDDMFVLHEKTNSVLQVTQLSDYYPFGVGFNVWNKESVKPNRYLYQQENQDDLDYDMYQYKYRMYDPSIGRFGSIDPMATSYLSDSPYGFVLNNPILMIDPDGRSAWTYNFYVRYNARTDPNALMQSYFNNAYQAVSPINNLLQQRVYGPMLEKWNSDLTQFGGKYSGYGDYGEGYASGKYGTFNQVMYYAGNFVPFAGIPKGLMDARKGDYGSAALSLGAGFAELGVLKSLLQSTRSIYRAVSEAELNSIQSSNGIFSITPKSMPGKWFANNINDASMWGKNFYRWDKEPFSIVEAKIPSSFKFDLSYGSGFDGSKFGGVYVDQSNLANFNNALLKVNYFNWMPIPIFGK